MKMIGESQQPKNLDEMVFQFVNKHAGEPYLVEAVMRLVYSSNNPDAMTPTLFDKIVAKAQSQLNDQHPASSSTYCTADTVKSTLDQSQTPSQNDNNNDITPR